MLILGPAEKAAKRRESIHLKPRSKGCHLSDIYEALDVLVNPQANRVDEDKLKVYGSMGFLFEHMMANALTEALVDGVRYERPGEFNVDGIAMSPDIIDKKEWSIWDTKVTWKSSNKLENVEKWFWKWLVQGKGYCHAANTDHHRVIAYFINGDYRGSGPIIRSMDLWYTTRELKENWDMCVKFGRSKGWIK